MKKEQYKKVGKRKYQQLFGGELMKRVLIGSILLVIASVVLKIPFKLLLFFITVVMFNAKLVLFQGQRGLPTDFELSTFGSVLVTVTYGWRWGLFWAVGSKLFASIYSGYIIADHFFMMFTYCVAVVLASAFSGVPILTLGLIIVFINAGLMFFISKNILGLDITSNMSYTGTNLMFNVVVFLTLSEVVKILIQP